MAIQDSTVKPGPIFGASFGASSITVVNPSNFKPSPETPFHPLIVIQYWTVVTAHALVNDVSALIVESPLRRQTCCRLCSSGDTCDE